MVQAERKMMIGVGDPKAFTVYTLCPSHRVPAKMYPAKKMKIMSHLHSNKKVLQLVNIKNLRSSGRRLLAWPCFGGGQYERVLKFVSTAKSEGATILCGGARPEHLVEPTIVTDVTTSMHIWREEVFGPVLCGLGAAVISNDIERCERFIKAFRAGVVWVSCSQPCVCQAPWGGNKRSGFGRELGEWGLDNCLRTKQVTQYISDEPWLVQVSFQSCEIFSLKKTADISSP